MYCLLKAIRITGRLPVMFSERDCFCGTHYAFVAHIVLLWHTLCFCGTHCAFVAHNVLLCGCRTDNGGPTYWGTSPGQFSTEESWFPAEESWFPIEQCWFCIKTQRLTLTGRRWCQVFEFVFQMMDFRFKWWILRFNVISKTRNFAFQMMNFDRRSTLEERLPTRRRR